MPFRVVRIQMSLMPHSMLGVIHSEGIQRWRGARPAPSESIGNAWFIPVRLIPFVSSELMLPTITMSAKWMISTYSDGASFGIRCKSKVWRAVSDESA